MLEEVVAKKKQMKRKKVEKKLAAAEQGKVDLVAPASPRSAESAAEQERQRANEAAAAKAAEAAALAAEQRAEREAAEAARLKKEAEEAEAKKQREAELLIVCLGGWASHAEGGIHRARCRGEHRGLRPCVDGLAVRSAKATEAPTRLRTAKRTQKFGIVLIYAFF